MVEFPPERQQKFSDLNRRGGCVSAFVRNRVPTRKHQTARNRRCGWMTQKKSCQEIPRLTQTRDRERSPRSPPLVLLQHKQAWGSGHAALPRSTLRMVRALHRCCSPQACSFLPSWLHPAQHPGNNLSVSPLTAHEIFPPSKPNPAQQQKSEGRSSSLDSKE